MTETEPETPSLRFAGLAAALLFGLAIALPAGADAAAAAPGAVAAQQALADAQATLDPEPGAEAAPARCARSSGCPLHLALHRWF